MCILVPVGSAKASLKLPRRPRKKVTLKENKKNLKKEKSLSVAVAADAVVVLDKYRFSTHFAPTVYITAQSNRGNIHNSNPSRSSWRTAQA